MIELGAALAAIIAGIGWFIRDLPGILSARRLGTIRSKSYGAPIIRREDDPERFDRLIDYRRKRLIWPTLMLVGGLALLGFYAWTLSRGLAAAGAA